MLIDGELQETASGRLFEIIDPATEEVAGRATDGTVADVERAVAAARRAFDSTDWSRDVEFRYHCMTQLRDALEAEKERLRRIVVTEVGTPIAHTHNIQLDFPLMEAGHWPEFGRRFEYWRDTGIHEGVGGSARRIQQFDPVGVVGAITPWNCPLYLNIAECVPALMAGNAVVLKPAQLTPWSGSEIGRIAAEKTDIPPGIFNVVLSNANEAGAALSSDPRVDMITFTGSTATGRKILAAAAPSVKRVLAELGGKSTHIVLDDADLASCLPMAAAAACSMSGQSCSLCSRVLLPRSRYAEGIEILKAAMEAFPYGDPWDPRVFQGPQISEAQRQKVLRLIRSGLDSGATLVTGGGVPDHLPRGYFVEPTLLRDVDPASEIAQEEIFGPVITVSPYETEDEAIAIANNTIYGLSGEVTSASTERALRVAARVRTGTMTVNGGSFFGVTSPLGGYKQSGLGRRNGVQGFEEYLEIKTIGLPV
jgi:acyl-CoA reductase-like NAD-dependent aldehyde dehydrogenase